MDKLGCVVGVGVLVLLAIVLCAAVVFPWSFYNQVVSLDTQVDNAWANVQVELQRRMDLVPNLVAVVEEAGVHEEEIFNTLAEARTKLAGAIDRDAPTDEQAMAANEFETALSRLLALAEDNPELQAYQSFLQLQQQLQEIENEVRGSRREYNDRVREYNRTIRLFPGNLLAKPFGFESHVFFEAAPGAEEAPQVEFE